MKKMLIYLITFILLICWIALGAFGIYFTEYGIFKIISFLFLSSVTFLYVKYLHILKSQKLLFLFRYKLLLSIKAVIVFFIFCMLHYLNTKQHSTFDLTLQKLYKVRAASTDLVKDLAVDHEIVFTFWGTKDHWLQNEELLLNYKDVSEKVKVHWINPDKNPEKASMVQGRELPILLLEYAGKKQWIEVLDEWVISIALKGFKQKNEKRVCFLSTHQVRDIESNNDEGLSEFKNLIQSEGYVVQKFNLTNEEQAKNCHLMMVIGPRDDFLQSEIELLKNYIKTKPIIFALGAINDQAFNKNLRKWIKSWGVDSSWAPMIDQSVMQFGEEAINILWEANHHQIAEPWSMLSQIKGRVLLQLTTSFEKQAMPHNTTIDPVIFSQPFPKTWQESDWEGVTSGKVIFDEKKDKKGPLAMGISIKGADLNQVILIGTDRLWMNGFKNYPANFTLGLNLLKSVLNDTPSVSSESVILREERLFLHQSQANLIFYLSIIVMPLIMLVLAFLIFRKNSSK